jgi:hypothetical protein
MIGVMALRYIWYFDRLNQGERLADLCLSERTSHNEGNREECLHIAPVMIASALQLGASLGKPKIARSQRRQITK